MKVHIGVNKPEQLLGLLTMLDLSYMFMDMTKDINTKASEFKIIEDKKDEPNYKEVSKFVGGMVECVQFPNGDLLLLNEEGKLMQLPLNPEATTLWRATFTKDKYAFGYDDFVVGPAMLIKKDALKIWAS